MLVRVSSEYTKLPLYVTESGASFHDYVDPEGRKLSSPVRHLAVISFV